MNSLVKVSILMAIVSLLILLVFPDIYITVNEILKKLMPQSLLKLSTQSIDKRAERSETPEQPNSCLPDNQRLFTRDLLAKYDGTGDSLGLYLGFLGSVYDVSRGAHHYKPGGSYSFFAGRDATRAFISGDFSDKGLVDDLTGIETNSFDGVKTWLDLYERDYIKVGRVVGVYYDEKGCETDALRWVYEQMEENNRRHLAEQDEAKLFPYCNSEWSADQRRGRVWCTSLSGGTQRDWVGLPRQLFMPDKKEYRCACVRDSGPSTAPNIVYDDEGDQSEAVDEPDVDHNVGDLNNPRLKLYDGCDKDSVECIIKD